MSINKLELTSAREFIFDESLHLIVVLSIDLKLYFYYSITRDMPLVIFYILNRKYVLVNYNVLINQRNIEAKSKTNLTYHVMIMMTVSQGI